MKRVMTLIRKLMNQIFSTGEYIDFGCDPKKMLIYQQMAYGLNRNKGVCTVSGWQILTIRPCDVDRTILKDLIEEYKLQPAFLVAEYVIEDDINRFEEGTAIRTSFLVSYHQNCLFETENTIYVLVGSGTRATISARQAEILFGKKGMFTK